MRSSWIKKVTAFAVLAMMVPAAVFAQTSRVQGMGLQGDYIKDYSNIYTYTSEVGNVGNLIWGELGNSSTSDRGVGAVLGNLWDGRYGTWGVTIHEYQPALGQGDVAGQPNPGDGGADPNMNTNPSFDVMWANRIGNNNVGIRLYRAYYEHVDQLPTVTTTMQYDPATGLVPNLSRNIFGVAVGFGFEMNPNTSVELAFDYSNRAYESSTTPGGAMEEEDSPTTYMISGRAFWEWQPGVTLVPVGKWYSTDLSRKLTPAAGTGSTVTNEMRGWQVGVAGNWALGTDDLFVLGVTFAGNKLEQQEDLFGIAAGAGTGDTLTVNETFTPLVFAALETHVNDWLTLRFGANNGAFSRLDIKDEGAAQRDLETTFSDFEMSLGAGVKLGTLMLDATLASDFPQTLGGWFSQTSSYNSFTKVTATYAF